MSDESAKTPIVEEQRQTGRTTGILLEALGKAIQHPSPGYSVFEDHGGGAHDWATLRMVAARLEVIIELLGLQGIEFQEGENKIRITSNFKGEVVSPTRPNWFGFRKGIEAFISRYGMEKGSDTPDFVLSKYLASCLSAYDTAVVARDCWTGKERPKPE